VIHVVVQNGELVLKQLLRKPSVYLDHCALRKISEDAVLSKRLVDTIRAKNGTLVVSITTRTEFIPVSDGQALVADRLLAELWPQLFFMDIDPSRVAQLEIKLLPTTRYPDGSLACDDQAFLAAFTARIKLDAAAVQWSAGEMFRAYPPREETRAYLDKMVRDGRLTMARVHESRATPVYKAARKKFRRRMRATGIGAPRATGPLMTTMLEMFDEAIPSPRDNDFTDFLHACVPSSYCTFVFLDSGWRHIVNRVRTDLAKGNIRTPIAQVFAEKDGGMERFFRALETHPTSPPLPSIDFTQVVAAVRAGIVLEFPPA
jgi:hypothetical protein